MVYTEIRNINGKKYYYRVISVRNGSKVSKKREYMGSGLSNFELEKKEKIADKQLIPKKVAKINKEIENIKSKIVKILKKNNVKKAGIFGSYSRGEQKKNSDVDILIEPTDKMSLLDISGIKIELEESLGKKVDVVSYKYIHPYLKKRILKSEVKII